MLYCTPLQNIAWIYSYSTGLHIHNPLFTAKFCSKVSDINTKLIKTQFSLQESLLKNIPQVEKHFKTLEKLLTFEPNISEYNLFSDTFIYRRFKWRNTFDQKFIYTNKNTPTNFGYNSSVEEISRVVFPTVINVSD